MTQRSRLTHWILDENHTPVPAAKIVEWAIFNEAVNRRCVAETDVTPEVRVSTVFLGIDHNYSSEGLPVLFETMAFGGPLDDFQERYSSWEEAEIGHELTVARIRQEMGIPPPPPLVEPPPGPLAPTWHERLLNDDED